MSEITLKLLVGENTTPYMNASLVSVSKWMLKFRHVDFTLNAATQTVMTINHVDERTSRNMVFGSDAQKSRSFVVVEMLHR